MLQIFGAVIAIFVGIGVLGLFLEFLRLFGIYINGLLVWPVIAVVLIIKYREKLLAAYYHAFVKYPVSTISDAALVDKTRAGYEHQTVMAKTISSKLDADGDIADAVIRRERARAALQDAERDVQNIERGSGQR